MNALFGGIVAFLLVLGLIGAGAFLWRRFGGGMLSSTGPRGRQARLAVIDAATVDSRRRLVLIRCDDTEHLLMIGGPTDIVVEPNIVRAAANGAAREARPVPIGELPPRQAGPADEASWPGLADALPRLARTVDAAEAMWREPMRAEPLRQDPLRQDPLRPDPLREDALLQGPLRQEAMRQDPLHQEAVRQDPLRLDPLRLEPVPPEPPRLPRELMAAEPARTAPVEPGTRSAPPVSAERFFPDFDREAEAVPPSMPPEPVFQPAVAPEPRRMPQPAPPPAYEPVFHAAPAPGPKWPEPPASLPIEPAPPSLEPRRAPIGAPPAYEPAFRAPAEPSRSPPMRAPSEPREPAFEPSVIREPNWPETAPSRPSQTDKDNLAEMAQRLEAALRRPTRPVEPPPAPPPRATARFEPAAAPAPRVAAASETPSTRTPEPGAAAVNNPPRPERPVTAAVLEAEMANLLGRPTGGT